MTDTTTGHPTCVCGQVFLPEGVVTLFLDGTIHRLDQPCVTAGWEPEQGESVAAEVDIVEADDLTVFANTASMVSTALDLVNAAVSLRVAMRAQINDEIRTLRDHHARLRRMAAVVNSAQEVDPE